MRTGGNLPRRHLNEIQRAMVAARPANMRQGERTDIEPSANLRKVSQAEAATMLDVSTHTIASARQVFDYGTAELQRAVDKGKIVVSQTAKLTKAEREVQLAFANLAEAEGLNAAALTMCSYEQPRWRR
jgi:hypothetical protein